MTTTKNKVIIYSNKNDKIIVEKGVVYIKINIKKLDLLIAKMGMSIKEFSKYSHINETTLCRIRNGKQVPSIKTIGKLAKALKVEPEEIIEN